MASTLSSYLPPIDGWLPKWLLGVSIISVANSIQAYCTLTYTERVYNNDPNAKAPKASSSPVNSLSARTFGTWTFLSSIIRLYAAYHIDDPLIYQLALWTYGIAFFHFASEWLVFGTAKWGAGLAGPVVVSTASLTWMWMQHDYYVRI